MVYNDLYKAIINFIASNWTTTTVVYPNDDGKSITNKKYYLEVHIVPFPTIRRVMTATTNTGLYYTGQVVLNLYRRKGTGVGKSTEYVDTLCDLFRYANIVVGSSSVNFLVPEVTDMGPQDKWYQINISIPYEYSV
jgi:hypothetical protein